MNPRKQQKTLLTASISRQQSLFASISSARVLPNPPTAHLSTLTSGTQKNPQKRPESEHALTRIIEEKVSSLQSKFSELSGLRKTFVGRHQSSTVSLSNTLKNTSENNESNKNSEFLNTKIFASQDKRKENSLANEKINYKKNFGKSEFEEILFDCADDTKKKWEIGLDRGNLQERLEKAEKKLEESNEKLRKSEKTIKQLKILMNSQEETSKEEVKKLREHAKILQLQINRLESQLRTIDSKKSTNTNAIRNLSYIILSKDSPTKDSPTKLDSTNPNNQITLKYLETLNELHSSDKLTLQIFEKIQKNKLKEANEMISDIQDKIIERLEKTRENMEELENIVYESKSSIKSTQIDEKKEEIFETSERISQLDLLGFLRCEATMVEELLIVS